MQEQSDDTGIDPNALARAEAHHRLQSRFRGGAAWFFWIAVLSLINSTIALSGGEWTFMFGLGATQVVDGFALGAIEEGASGGAAKMLAVALDLVIASIYAFFGFYARRGAVAAFGIGMALYALDALLVLAFRDYLGAAFHGWVLFSLFNGLRALRELRASTAALASAPASQG